MLCAVLLVASCGSGEELEAAGPDGRAAPDRQGDDSRDSAVEDRGRDEDGGGEARDDEEDDGEGPKKACPDPTGRSVDASEEAVVLQAGGDGGPRVEAVVYPHPDYEGELWSQWGQGLASADGLFYSAVGDHCGVNGDAYLYEYDAFRSSLRLREHVLSLVDHEPGAWGYGKIHAPMVAGPDGAVYTTTYWGTDDGLEYENGYEGDLLLRLDTSTGEWTSLGVPVPEHGIPSLAGYAEKGLLYGEAADPDAEPKKGLFFVYDTKAGEVVFEMDKAGKGFRSVMVDGEGRAYFSTGDRRLHVYDPTTNEAIPFREDLPGAWLRASSQPAPDGTVYGVTRNPDTLFALRSSGEIDELGPVRGYVASLALAPDGEQLFYVPEAHGKSWEQGTPLVAVDTRTGEEKVVVELNELAEDQLDLRLGGSYNVAVDPSGDRVYVGLNAAAPDADETFGTVVLAVIELP
ncbi:MAG: hypothetical protein M3N25_01265 [Actinomycetota bacterium]|nr:hypothetical protein [Actinomycetota bacterium]